MAELEFNGGSFYYEVDGDPSAPVLVLIHAGVASLRMWDEIVPSLATSHRIVRYDTRGFGRTTTTDVHFSDLDDLLAILAETGVDQATLIGASRGGRIAIDAVVEHPDRFTGLVTIGAGPSGFPEIEMTERENELVDEIDALLASGDRAEMYRRETELWAAGPTRDLLELDPAFLTRAYELNDVNVAHFDDVATPVPLESPAYYRTVDIEIPSLFVIGEHDLSSELAATEYLLSTVPDSSGARFPDSAHLPSVERSDEFLRILATWLQTHEL